MSRTLDYFSALAQADDFTDLEIELAMKGEATMSHTPGPWTVEFENEIHPPARISQMSIAIVDKEHAEWKDNARLMAAAPKMLAACESAAKWFETGHGNPNHPVLIELSAAIAEAKGQ